MWILSFIAICSGISYSKETIVEGDNALDFTLPYLLDSSKELALSDHYGTGKEKRLYIFVRKRA